MRNMLCCVIRSTVLPHYVEVMLHGIIHNFLKGACSHGASQPHFLTSTSAEVSHCCVVLLPHRASIVLTASAVMRGTKRVDLKKIVDDGVAIAEKNGYRGVKRMLVVEKGALPVSAWSHARQADQVIGR